MGEVRQDMLFDVGTPREFHESESQQQEALQILRHRKLTKSSFEQDWKKDGSRLAPAINVLRKGWGFDIAGTGKKKDPYWLLNPNQHPCRVRTTERMKELYWGSAHWMDMKEKRHQHDDYRCVLCVESCREVIQCHHVTYNLFQERLDELMTVCKSHHEMIHKASRLIFPIGVDLWVAERLLGIATYKFESWLLP